MYYLVACITKKLSMSIDFTFQIGLRCQKLTWRLLNPRYDTFLYYKLLKRYKTAGKNKSIQKNYLKKYNKKAEKKPIEDDYLNNSLR